MENPSLLQITSFNDKLEALTLRIIKLQNQNRTLKLEVKELKFEVDTIKNNKPRTGSKNNHTTSTHSINQKPSRNSEKIMGNGSGMQRVDEKKKEPTRPTKTVLTPSNSNQNTFSNQLSKQADTKTSKTILKAQDSKYSNSSAYRTQPRKATLNSSSSNNLLKPAQPKKSFQFYSFMSSLKEDAEKVISIQKLDPSYQNSPSRIQKIDALIIEQDQNEDYDREVQNLREYQTVKLKTQSAMKKNKSIPYL